MWLTVTVINLISRDQTIQLNILLNNETLQKWTIFTTTT